MPTDAQDVFKIYADPEVTGYYDLDTFTRLEQAFELIDRQATRFEGGDIVRWGIARKRDDIIIGTCGYVFMPSHGWGGVGYDLARPFWRQGIMSEALGAIIEFGFQTVNLNRIQALVMPGNTPSMKLLLKLGFQEEGLLREYAYFKGRYQDLHCYSLLQGDWPPTDNPKSKI